MKLIKYITFGQLYYWSQTTSPFSFNGSLVSPSIQMSTVEQILLPFLNGSMDNPYSTTDPAEKLPTYFTVAGDIGNYLDEEYGDRLVASKYRGGEFYPPINRNLTNDEAMEVILQELVSKTYHFISVYGYQFIKIFGTAALKYDPRYSIQEHIRKVLDFGIHETDNNYGARLKTDTLGPTSETVNYGAQSGSTTIAARTNDHSETQMNNTTTPNLKTRDLLGGGTDSQTVATHSDTTTTLQAINTSGDQAVKDTITDKAHQNIETTDREATGVKTIQELIEAERQILDFNPVIEFFKAYTDKVMLRCYYY